MFKTIQICFSICDCERGHNTKYSMEIELIKLPSLMSRKMMKTVRKRNVLLLRRGVGSVLELRNEVG